MSVVLCARAIQCWKLFTPFKNVAPCTSGAFGNPSSIALPSISQLSQYLQRAGSRQQNTALLLLHLSLCGMVSYPESPFVYPQHCLGGDVVCMTHTRERIGTRGIHAVEALQLPQVRCHLSPLPACLQDSCLVGGEGHREGTGSWMVQGIAWKPFLKSSSCHCQ